MNSFNIKSRCLSAIEHPFMFVYCLTESLLLKRKLKQFGIYYQKSNLFSLDNKNFEHSGPRWYNCCQILFSIIRSTRPKIVVETGVSDGISTAFILEALRDNNYGKLYSIDVTSKVYYRNDKKIGWFIPKELKERWVFVEGRSQDKLRPLLSRLGEVDIFLHDSQHTYDTMKFEYECAWDFMKKSGFLLSDDVLLTNVFKEFSQDKKHTICYRRLGIIEK